MVEHVDFKQNKQNKNFNYLGINFNLNKGACNPLPTQTQANSQQALANNLLANIKLSNSQLS